MADEVQNSEPVPEPQTAPASAPAEGPKSLFDQALADVNQAAAAAEQPASAAAPSLASPGEQQAVSQQPEVVGPLAYLKEQGHDLTGRFTDDDAFLRAAVETMKRQEATQPYLDSYLQHAAAFQQYLSEQQKAQQQKASEPKPWQSPYDRGEVQRLLADYYERGEDGQLKPKANAPADVLSKVGGYERWARDWGDRLVNDPKGALAPLIQEEARTLVQQELANYQQTQAAKAVIDRHAEWIYDAKQSRPGRPVLTLEGQLFRDKVVEAERLGVRDLEGQERYALQMVEAELLRRKQKPLEQQQAANRQVAGLNRRPNVSPASAPHTGQPAVPPSREGLSLVEQMREALRDFSDQDMAAVS